MQRFDFDILDSTNDEARRLLAAGVIDRSAAIVARGQTAGRGTHGRSWASPAGAGLYISYICRNRNASDSGEVLPLTTAYTKAAGVACVEAVREELGIVLGIKPVNDLIWDGRKLGGILTEAFVENERMTALIVGIGINVHPAVRNFPADSLSATSLAEAVAPMRLPDSIIEALERRVISKLVARLSPSELAGVEPEWRKHLIDVETA